MLRPGRLRSRGRRFDHHVDSLGDSQVKDTSKMRRCPPQQTADKGSMVPQCADIPVLTIPFFHFDHLQDPPDGVPKRSNRTRNQITSTTNISPTSPSRSGLQQFCCGTCALDSYNISAVSSYAQASYPARQGEERPPVKNKLDA
ncbi:hypothetical protein CBR_g2866 [Chara braunii]|uniref:Uncharacterized protein n=1 Tax=Chara braunii TaxID=69332 RepID=A0A388KE35_CHABU|nr:hypothetical protein CBR_g2866 [Chara braunii]|eukprot:GBG68322.1 hypothetical protein CBR_g2866 [Chara braunii]